MRDAVIRRKNLKAYQSRILLTKKEFREVQHTLGPAYMLNNDREK